MPMSIDAPCVLAALPTITPSQRALIQLEVLRQRPSGSSELADHACTERRSGGNSREPAPYSFRRWSRGRDGVNCLGQVEDLMRELE